jgi:hypothetical protein
MESPKISFPDFLCPAMANMTKGFSFAYLQEGKWSSPAVGARQSTSDALSAFVATLLASATGDGAPEAKDDRSSYGSEYSDAGVNYDDGGDDRLERYVLWHEFRKQVKVLRGDMGGELHSAPSTSTRLDDSRVRHMLEERNLLAEIEHLRLMDKGDVFEDVPTALYPKRGNVEHSFEKNRRPVVTLTPDDPSVDRAGPQTGVGDKGKRKETVSPPSSDDCIVPPTER